MNSGYKFARPLLFMMLWVGAALLLNASQAVAAPVPSLLTRSELSREPLQAA